MKNYNTNSGAASHWRMISCGDNNHRSAIYTCFMTDFKMHQKTFYFNLWTWFVLQLLQVVFTRSNLETFITCQLSKLLLIITYTYTYKVKNVNSPNLFIFP